MADDPSLNIPSWQGSRDAKGGVSQQLWSWLQSVGTFVNQTGKQLSSLAASFSEAQEADYQNNNAGFLCLTPETVWQAIGFTNLTDGASIPVDMSAGFNFQVTIQGNRVLSSPSNAKTGQSGVFKVTSSGALRTLNLAANYKATVDIVQPVSIPQGNVAYIFYWVDSPTRIIITSVLVNPT